MDRTWVAIGNEADFEAGLKSVTVGAEKLVVSRLEGKLFACQAKCPHAGISMEHAEVEGSILTCPLHGWRFDMNKCGEEIHGYRGLDMRDIKVEDGLVYIAA